jgi:hypothetical protein
MKLNLARLDSIAITLNAVAEIEKAMEWYADTSKVGPAYMSVRAPVSGESISIDVQVDRQEFLEFMKARKEKLIKHLEERFDGFEYDPEADWAGDY